MYRLIEKSVIMLIVAAMILSTVTIVYAEVNMDKYDFFEIEKNLPFASTIGSTTKMPDHDGNNRVFNSKALDNSNGGYFYDAEGTPLKVGKDANGNYVRKIGTATSGDGSFTFEGTYTINVQTPAFYKEISVMGMSSYEYGDNYDYIKNKYNFTVTYEDGTSDVFGPKEVNFFTTKAETKKDILLASETASYVLMEKDSQNQDNTMPWLQWSDSTGYSVNSYFDKLYIPVYKLAVNETKKVSKIEIIATQGVSYYQVVLAVTAEKADASAVIGALFDKLPEASAINTDNYLEYKTIIENIEALDSSVLTAEQLAKIAEIKAVINELNFNSFVTVDFSQNFNAKVFAPAGSAVADWDALNYISAYVKVGDVYVPNAKRGLNKTGFEAAKDDKGLIYSNAKIPFDINTNGAIAFGGRSDPLKDEEIFFDGFYADKLYFVLASTGENNDKSKKNHIIINYDDETSTTLDFNNFHGIVSTAPTTDYVGFKKLPILTESGNTIDEMRYIDVFEADTEMNKAIVSIKFVSADKYFGHAVVGITSKLASKSETKAVIENKIQKIAVNGVASSEADINAVKALIDHAKPYYETNFADESVFEEIYEEYMVSAAKIKESSAKTDLDNTTIKVEFVNEMNEEELLENIEVTLNGVKTTDYIASYSNKVLSVSYENDLDYDKEFVLTIPAGVKSANGMALRNAYTYKFSAEEPLGYSNYSQNDNNISLTLKNYLLEASQPYFVTVAHIGADGAVKNSKLVKGTLAKNATVSKNYSFDLLEEGEKIVVYTVDSLSSLKSIVAEQGTEVVASAEGNATEKLVVNPVNLSDNTVKIEGVISSNEEGKRVNIIILNPSVNISSNGEYTDAIQNQTTVLTAKDGYFSATLKLNNQASGTFKVYANGEESSFFFASDNAKNDLIANVLNSGNKTLIESKLAEIYLNFGVDKFRPVEIADADVIADAIIKGAPYAENDFASVQKCIQEAAVVDLYNKGNKAEITDGNLNFLYDDVLAFSKLDEEKNCTIYGAYLNVLNNEGKNAVVNSLLNKNFASLEDLQSALLKSIITKGVNMTDLLGTAHIKALLTKANADAVNMDISTYIGFANSGKVDKDLSVAQEYADIDALALAIKNLVAKYPVTTPPSGGGGGGGGGVSAPITNAVAGVVGSVENNNPVNIPTTEINYSFKDLSDSRWAEEAIDALVEKKAIAGFPDNTFRPNDGITREQIIKVLCIVNNIEPDYDYQFKFDDVDYNEWYAPYVNAAYKNKITLGVDEKNFGIGRVVTRQDLVTMIYRISNKETLKQTKTFADQSEISEYATEAVNYFAVKGFVSGYEDGSFKPLNNCTRAEAVVIIYNVSGGNK